LIGQTREIQALKAENERLRAEIQVEERWLKQVALDIIDSEEQAMTMALQSLWQLSQNRVNGCNIARVGPVVATLISIFDSETNRSLAEASIGILGNICGTDEGRDQMLTQCFGPSLDKLIQRAKQVLDDCICATKLVELTTIFVFNLSLSDSGANALLESWMAESLISLIGRLKEYGPTDASGMAVKILDELFGSACQPRMMYLTYDVASGIIEVTSGIPVTTSILHLRTAMRIAFPGI
jgi:hypothetical protein